MGKITIKIATLEDTEAYKAIRYEAVNNDPSAFGLFSEEDITREIGYLSKEYERDILNANRFVVLSKHGTNPIGMVKGVRRKNGYWFLRSVYLNKNFRKNVTGNSTSKEMVLKFIEEVKRRNGNIVRLWVLNSNKNAFRLYKRIGFKKISFIRSILIVRGKINFLFTWRTMELKIKDFKADS